MGDMLLNTISTRPAVSIQNGNVRSIVARKKNYLFLKRCFDLIFSGFVIVFLLSWLIPFLAILIKLDSRGPVFFRQKRIGKRGRPFYCIKFRTMVQNEEADERPAELNDDRVTRVGRFLRVSNLDELPQFFNVLLGQMSIVGPRPHMLTDCVRFSFVISSYSFRSLVKPGITGWAQINGFHGPVNDYENIMLRYYWDAQYIRRRNFWLDIKIIVQTIRKSISALFTALKPNKNSQQYC